MWTTILHIVGTILLLLLIGAGALTLLAVVLLIPIFIWAFFDERRLQNPKNPVRTEKTDNSADVA
jgi:hypothetical protein